MRVSSTDCGGVVDDFFWDTDFLNHTMVNLASGQRQRLGVSPETFGLTAGMKPHPEEWSMKLCHEGEKRDFDGKLSEVFVPGSKAYPSFPECPEESIPK